MELKYSLEARLTSVLVWQHGNQIPCSGFGEFVTPELVKTLSAVRGKLPSHLQAIGLHQIKRSQHAVQARQNPQVSWAKLRSAVLKFPPVAQIYIASERKDCLLGVVQIKGVRQLAKR